MKAIKFQLVALLCFAFAGMILSSCNKHDHFEDDDYEWMEEFPDEDQMQVTCSLSSYISPRIPSNGVVPFVKKRLSNVENQFTENTKVVLLSGSELAVLSHKQRTTLSKIFMNGGSILAYKPTIGAWDDFEEDLGIELLDLIDFSNYNEEDLNIFDEMLLNSAVEMSYDEDLKGVDRNKIAGEWMGININTGSYQMDELNVDDQTEVTYKEFELDENGDEVNVFSEKEERVIISYNDFEYGTFADGVMNWLNITKEEMQQRSEAFKAKIETRAESQLQRLSDVMRTEQQITRDVPVPIRFNGSSDKKLKAKENKLINPQEFDRAVNLSVVIQYACLHEFKSGRDYYIFDQVLSVHNGSLRCPIGPKTWGREDSAKGASHSTHMWLGPYMYTVSISDMVKVSGGTVALLREKAQPANQNVPLKIRNPLFFGISLDLAVALGSGGLNNGAKSGLSLSLNREPTIISEIKSTMESNGSDNVGWTYRGGRPAASTNFWGTTTHTEVQPMLRGDAVFDQVFVFNVDNPNQKPVYLHIGMDYEAELLLVFFRSKDHPPYHSISVNNNITPERLVIPAHYKENWTRSILAEGGNSQAKAQKVEAMISTYMSKYSKKVLEITSPYSPEQLKNPIIWNKSIMGSYLKDFKTALETSGAMFVANDGPGPGRYTITYAFPEGGISKSFIAVVNDEGVVSVREK